MTPPRLPLRTSLAAIAAAVTIGGLLFPSLAHAVPAGLDLKSAAGYGVIDINDAGTFNMNSGPVSGGASGGFGGPNNAGSVVIAGTNFSTSGGNNGQITGNLYYDSNSTGNFGSGLQVPVTAGQKILITSTQVNQQITDILAVDTYIKGLAATQAFSNSMTGNGGLNVISVGNLSNPAFSLTGTSNDYFVFKVSGLFNTNQPMTLNGVDPSHIFWDFTGTNMTVFQTSGGNTLFGTFIAASGGSHFQFSNLNLTGGLIQVNGNGIQYVSGTKNTGFCCTNQVPETGGTLFLLGIGVAGLLAGAAVRAVKLVARVRTR